MKARAKAKMKSMPLSTIFDALSDPIRLEIIQILLNEKEISCGQCKSGLSKSTMSHHFKVLREAGLIQRREEGKVHFISLNAGIESQVPGLLKMLRKTRLPL